jgi:formate hydrogenlyase transcriptional activator
MEKNRIQFKRPCQGISPISLEKLLQYEWPGNIRELKNVIERAMILSESTILHLDESFLKKPVVSPAGLPPTQLKDLERLRIEQALETSEWRIEGPLGAAKQLGLHPSTLRYRIKKLGLRSLAKS